MRNDHGDYLIRIRERLPMWRADVVHSGQNNMFDSAITAIATSPVYDLAKDANQNWQVFADTMMKKAACLYSLGFSFEAQLSSRLFNAEERVFAMLWGADVFLNRRRGDILWFIEFEMKQEEWHNAESLANLERAIEIVSFFRDIDTETADLIINSMALLKSYMFDPADNIGPGDIGGRLEAAQKLYLARIEDVRSFVGECMMSVAPDWNITEPLRRCNMESVVTKALEDIEPLYYASFMAVYDGNYLKGDELPPGHQEKIEWMDHLKSLKTDLLARERTISLRGFDHDDPASVARCKEKAGQLRVVFDRLRRVGIEVHDDLNCDPRPDITWK